MTFKSANYKYLALAVLSYAYALGVCLVRLRVPEHALRVFDFCVSIPAAALLVLLFWIAEKCTAVFGWIIDLIVGGLFIITGLICPLPALRTLSSVFQIYFVWGFVRHVMAARSRQTQ